MRGTDVKFSARYSDAIDRAIESASDSIDGVCHRRFYNVDETKRWDWPNFQRAYPWRVWFDGSEVADYIVNTPVVTSGGILIPSNQIFWGPWNYSPPYTFLELDRSSNAAFGFSQTPQRDIAITATFGFWLKLTTAGTLASAVVDTTSTTITVSNSYMPGVGDVVTIDSERMLVTDRAMTSTGQTQQGTGVSTASMADVTLAVTDGTKYFYNEVLLLDSERMLVTDIAGNNLTVKRAWDGSVLATHSGATIYAGRQLLVTRGDFGTAASAHSQGAAVKTNVVPGLVRDVAVGESIVQTLQETGGYADPQGEGQSAIKNISAGLNKKWDKLSTRYARKNRQRVI